MFRQADVFSETKGHGGWHGALMVLQDDPLVRGYFSFPMISCFVSMP